ncbi:MAG: beta-carotene hydroxylase [Chitinophagaceae bacterium]
MNFYIYFGIIIVVFFLMEGITWLTHRFVMHGFLWFLHEDHHRKRPGFFEKNDAFFVIFAIPSFLCILIGTIRPVYWLQALGFGVMAYGFAYFLVHDVIIHQRFKWLTRTNNNYVKTIRWAHKMHHKHLDKEEGESFGMLMVHRRYFEKVRKEKKRRHFTIGSSPYKQNES